MVTSEPSTRVGGAVLGCALGKRTRHIRLERSVQFPDRLSEVMTGGIRNATLM